MARPGQDARRSPETAARAGSSGPAPAPRAPVSGFDQKLAVRLTQLALVGHVLRSRRLYAGLATAGIVLAALRGVGQENTASTMARLAAWNKREVQRLERKAKQLEYRAGH